MTRPSREEELEDELEILRQQVAALTPSSQQLGVLMRMRHGMTNRTAQILHILIKRYPAVVSRDSLHSLVYGSQADGGPEPRIFSVYITRLRGILRRIGAPGKIEAVWNAGWKATPELVKWVNEAYEEHIPQEK